MKILYIAYHAGMYGANKSLFNLILDLRNRYDIEPYVFTVEDGDFAEACQRENIPCSVLKYYRWNTVGNTFFCKCKKRIQNLLNHALYEVAFRKAVNIHPDIIHTNSSETNIGCYLSKKLGVPHIWHIREYGTEDYNLYYSYSDSYVRKEYEQAKAVVAISKSIFDNYVHEKKLCSEENTTVIYNGIRVGDAYAKQYFKDGVLNFCVCGLISENKNQLEVVHALKYLPGCNYKVYFIGSGDSDYIQRMKNLAQKYNVDQQIEFLGYRTDIDQILKNMDVGIVPSKKEAFGRVTVEYMLNYMPVIGANTGGTPELVTSTTGKLYELGNAEELSKAMNFFLQSRNQIKEMGNAARKCAVDNYSMKKNTDQIFKLYVK